MIILYLLENFIEVHFGILNAPQSEVGLISKVPFETMNSTQRLIGRSSASLLQKNFC